MFRTSNLNDGQRKFRMAAGVVVLVLSLYAPADIFRAIVIVTAIYGMITGIAGYCPLTEILVSPNRVRRSATHHSKKHRRR